MTESIVSDRLELVPLDVPTLRSLVEGDNSTTPASFRVPSELSLKRTALDRRIAQLEEDPSLLPWLMRAVVIRATRTMCGRIGFHSRPGAPELREVAPDGVELGYEIDPNYRRKGYATEAAIALMRWAFARHGQRSFVLSISPQNAPSLAMAASMGFREVGSQMDEEDGLELIFLRHIESWPVDWSREPR